MTIMTSREFNQRVSQAQKAAQVAPVIITNRGKPAYVLMTYFDYEQSLQPKPFKSIADALADTNPESEFVDLPLQPRSRGQRRPVDLSD